MNQCIRLLIFVSIGTFAAACSDPATNTETAKPDPWAALSDSERELLRHGEARARSCAACHGPQGISRNRMYPSIAGMSAEDITTALLAYRSGEIVNPLMSPQARGLSDEDIASLANYYELASFRQTNDLSTFCSNMRASIARQAIREVVIPDVRFITTEEEFRTIEPCVFQVFGAFKSQNAFGGEVLNYYTIRVTAKVTYDGINWFFSVPTLDSNRSFIYELYNYAGSPSRQ